MGDEYTQNKIIAVAGSIIFILVAVIGYLLYLNQQRVEVIEVNQVEMDQSLNLKAELEKEYYEALADLEKMRSDNADLNALIEQQKLELGKAKEQISILINENKDLERVRQEIGKLKEQAVAYINDLEKVKSENFALATANESLREEKEILREEVQKGRQQTDQLLTVKAALIREKDELAVENIELENKVLKASVVPVEEIEIKGVKIKDNGREVNRSRAKNIDQFNICFKALKNEITEAGPEVFHVRIINPLGETLAVESMGSGVIRNAAGDERIRFTKAREISYSKEEVITCLNWLATNELMSGEYKVEVYNKGFLAGSTTKRFR